MNSQEDWKANLIRMRRRIEQAIQKSSDAIVFPENTLYMGPAKHLFRVGREVADEALPLLRKWAAVGRIAILIGSYPEIRKGTKKVFNTSLWIDEKGRIAARYRKIHLFDVITPNGSRFSESKFVTPGAS